ncbi:uncharacterized protein LOC121053868 [Oryza brachyantha]|uniref:uncharacterized protein LOC121053868 n=1 Tax=Oryza brachyantha TaxID=4533 RepID=UPI001AD9F5EA|nr:uncharacterized protein LOC121053868 [Oryza brachyantha]
MFLRSKVQEMILRRRSRSMNSGGAQPSHLPGQHASSSAGPCDGGNGVGGGGKSGGAAACALFGSPRLLHCASLPSGSHAKNGGGGSEPETPYTMSPTSVLDAAAAFAPSPDAGSSKRRPWCDGGTGTHGLADALDCTDDDGGGQKRSVLAPASRAVRLHAQAHHRPLLRSCSLDRRVEFGVKNKSSWLPLRGGGGGELAPEESPGEMQMEPSSEDYTCVISRGPNPRTVHIFGDRVVEGSGGGEPLAGGASSDRESSPRPINLLPAPAREARGFLSL